MSYSPRAAPVRKQNEISFLGGKKTEIYSPAPNCESPAFSGHLLKVSRSVTNRTREQMASAVLQVGGRPLHLFLLGAGPDWLVVNLSVLFASYWSGGELLSCRV